MMPINVDRLVILNPVTLPKEKYLRSHQGSAELIRAVTGGGEFSNANYLRTLGEERSDGKKYWEVANKTKLKGLVQDLKGTDRRLILQGKRTGACLSVRGTTVSGTLLSATEFRNFLCARYNVSPLNLQSYCFGYDTAFGLMHTLIFITCGLVITRHNKTRDKLQYLSQCAFTSVSVRAEHLIHQGRTRSKHEIRQGSDKEKETRGKV